MVTLFAFLVRRHDLTHEEFLVYWHERHGPLIRDSRNLARHLVSYEQHPRMAAPESDKTEYDGVAVQVFASWDEFLAMLGEPDAQLMRDDEANFLDRDKLKVVFSDPSVNVLDS